MQSPLKEYEVALGKVSPFLRDQLGWPEKLISSYGTTPVPASKAAGYLSSTYRGFTRISDARVNRITNDFESIDKYLEKPLGTAGASQRKLPNFWWVCQGKTYEKERAGKFLWAPNKDKAGRIQPSWAAMEEVLKGDIIFHYAQTSIRAVSVVQKPAYHCPNELSMELWDKDGQKIDVELYDIEPIHTTRLKGRISELRRSISSSNHPFTKEGTIKQGYLFHLSYEAARIIREIYGRPLPDPVEKYFRDKVLDLSMREDSIQHLLRMKRQVILYGPPGTGKTFEARVIACELLEMN